MRQRSDRRLGRPGEEVGPGHIEIVLVGDLEERQVRLDTGLVQLEGLLGGLVLVEDHPEGYMVDIAVVQDIRLPEVAVLVDLLEGLLLLGHQGTVHLPQLISRPIP